jgi:hypothetical protein
LIDSRGRKKKRQFVSRYGKPLGTSGRLRPRGVVKDASASTL